MNTKIRNSPLSTSLAGDRRFSTARIATTLTVLAACSALATGMAITSNDSRSSVATSNHTEWITTSISNRLTSYAEVLYGVRHSFEYGQDDHASFQAEVERLGILSRLPGVQVIGAAHLVRSAEVTEHTLGVNQSSQQPELDYPEFDIYPSAVGTQFLPIDFIEPQVGNQKAFGLDFLSERNRRTAAEQARDSDLPAATGPVVLVQETGKQMAFLLMLPFYDSSAPTATVAERRDAFAGVVYAAFRMDDLIDGTFGSNNRTGLTIGDTESGEVLYGDDLDGAWTQMSEDDERVSTLDGFGRQWKIVVNDGVPALSVMERAMPVMIVSFGLLAIALFMATVRASRLTRARAEALALELTEELDALTAATSEAIITVDQTGHIVGWNPGASRMFEVAPDEILGRPAHRLVPHDARDDFIAESFAVLNSEPSDEERDHAIVLHGLRSGRKFPMEMTLSRWVARDERFTTAFIRDVTDRVEAERTLNETSELLRSVLSAATEMSIIATDAEGVVTVFNAGAELMLGYTADQVVGKTKPSSFHDPLELFDRALELGVDRRADIFSSETLTDAAETRVWTYIRNDGSRVPIELTRTPRYDSDGALCGSIAVAVDITTRLAAEADQQALLNQQRQIVTKLTEVDRVKSDFVSTMSHELRTPLTSIIGYTELLADDIAETGPTIRSGMVMMIEKNAQRLLNLVEDLLSLSQIESGLFRVKQESCDSAQILRSACESVALLALDRNIDIRLDLDTTLPEIFGDRGQLERVFVNLLANAVKFSTDCGVVEVSAHVNEHLVITVSDTGIGIPLDEQGQLFTRFFRSRTAHEHAIQGTGLGLAIVATIVDRHEGHIEVESAEGVGTTVTVTLPILGSSPSIITAEEAYA